MMFLCICKTAILFFSLCREGRSNAHIKGDYQRIGDVMLKNLQALKVTPDLMLTSMLLKTCSVSSSCITLHACSLWPQTCTSTLKSSLSWRRCAKRPVGWKIYAETLSCKKCATSPWMSSPCDLSTASFTTSRSWSACANTTQPLMRTSGTAEVTRAFRNSISIFSWFNLAVVMWYALLFSSCSGRCFWGGGPAPGESTQDGEPPEAPGATEGFARCWQSCGFWSCESEL